MVDALTAGFGLLFLLCAGLVVVSGRKLLAHPRAPSANTPPPSAAADQRLIARQVEDAEGQRLGETVRVEGEAVVIKAGEGFLVVPKSSLQELGEKLRVLEFHRGQAEAEGEAWRKRQEDVMRYDAKGLPLPDER